MPSISFIIPTLGRTSLAFPLARLCTEARPEDEVLIAADSAGDTRIAYEISQSVCEKLPCRWQVLPAPAGCYGNLARDQAIREARGERLVFMDDDDTWTPGGIAAIRAAAVEHPTSPLIFKMSWWNGAILWDDPVLEPENVGTPMFVPLRTPNLPKWADHCDRLSDYRWIKRVVAQQGPPVWREEVICRVDALKVQLR